MNVEMANPRTSEYEPDPDLRDREHVPRLEPGLGRVGEAGMIDQSKPPDSSAITPVANFDSLVRAITLAHESLLMKAVKAVNVSLTLRNWLIGFYIAVYEQQGADRATYGEHLLSIRFIRRFGRLCPPNLDCIWQRKKMQRFGGWRCPN
jgi:hypothetical protein